MRGVEREGDVHARCDGASVFQYSAQKDAQVERCRPRAFGGMFSRMPVRVGAQDLYEEVKEKLVPAVQALKMGDPKDEDVFIGPLISEKEAQRVEAWVQDARSRGDPLLQYPKGAPKLLYRVGKGPRQKKERYLLMNMMINKSGTNPFVHRRQASSTVLSTEGKPLQHCCKLP